MRKMERIDMCIRFRLKNVSDTYFIFVNNGDECTLVVFPKEKNVKLLITRLYFSQMQITAIPRPLPLSPLFLFFFYYFE